MMRAGKMTRVIELQRASEAVNDFGTPVSNWAKLATLRAELLEQSAEEFLRAAGETTEERLVFRTRFLADVGNDDRILFRGDAFDIEKITTIGRDRGLEFHCRRVTP